MKPKFQLVAAGSLVAADQLSKLVTSSVACGPRVCPVRNDALMLGVGHGPTAQVVLIGLAGLIAFGLWVVAVSRRAPLPQLAVVLVVAGIVGNLVDRVVLKSVRDFLAIPGGVVLNVADVAVVVGVLVCVVVAMRSVTIPPSHQRRGAGTQ
jgi:lipoprotein signal peptidase